SLTEYPDVTTYPTRGQIFFAFPTRPRENGHAVLPEPSIAPKEKRSHLRRSFFRFGWQNPAKKRL
ncbi:MAG: hypothetical protein LBF58_12715, partial [Deltaproteobacteria bacterium]|nr:hypothetical protein [Deltaproteobacteria bacterium]